MRISRERFNEILREERVPERIMQDYFWNAFEKSAPDVDEAQIRGAIERAREQIICYLISLQLLRRYYPNADIRIE